MPFYLIYGRELIFLWKLVTLLEEACLLKKLKIVANLFSFELFSFNLGKIIWTKFTFKRYAENRKERKLLILIIIFNIGL